MMTKQILRRAINLQGDCKHKYLEIQKKLGIRSGTDVFRFLINYFYDREIKGRE